MNRVNNLFKNSGGKVINSFKILLCLVFIFFFGLLALPNINFEIAGQQITFPKLDLSNIDPTSTIGNFRRGRDIFPTNEVKAQISFDSEDLNPEDKRKYLVNSVETFKKRINLSGLFDIEVKAEIENGNYYVIFNYPEYYKNNIQITSILTRKGIITFVDGQTQQEINLKDSDINSNVEIAYNSTIQSHLKFNFPIEKTNDLTTALASNYFLMSIDGNPEFQIFQYEQNDPTTNTVRGLPAFAETQTDIAFRDLYINVARTYFTEKEPLKYSFVVETISNQIPPVFSNLSTKYIAILSAIVFVALAIFSFVKFKIRKGIVFTLMTLTYLTFTVTFLKYISAPVSLVFILTYFILSGVATLFIWRLLNVANKNDMKIILKQILNVGLILIIINLILLKFVAGLGRFYDAFAPIIVFGISFIILSYFNFKILIEELILKFKKDE